MREVGRGAPLVVAPGGPGGFGTLWLRVLAPLALRHRIVTWDYRGCGGSRAAAPPTMAADLEDLVAVVTSVGGAAGDGPRDAAGAAARPRLLGHSYGGMLSLAAALDPRLALGGLVLACTTARYGALVEGARRARARLDEATYQARASLLGRCVRGEAHALDVQRYRAGGVDPALGQHAKAALLRFQAVRYPVRLAVQQDLWTFDLRARLGQVRAPTLVLSGDRDEVVGAAPSQLAAEVPGAHWRAFPGCGHSPQVEQRAEFLRVLEAWLEDLEAPPRRRPAGEC